jgi:two-component system, probable response regulator PhcQ
MPRILLVDDEPSVLSSLRRTIHFMPPGTFDDAVHVETFDKPELALMRAREAEFDLVISDWRMPVMNGIAFLGELIKIQPKIARLILSGYGEFLSEAEAIKRIRIFHFISKPWNNDELRSLMCRALAHRRQQLADDEHSEGDPRRCAGVADRPHHRSRQLFSFVDRIELQS